MNEGVWKSFEQNPITHSGAHYLMTIHEIQERKGYARASDVAKALSIAVPSCTQALKKLVKKGLVKMNEDKFYKLTDQGFEHVLLIEKNKEVLMEFFVHILGVDEKQADEDSCKIEHLLSSEASFKLCRFIKFMKEEQKAPKIFLDAFENQACCSPEKESTCPYRR